MRSKNFIHSIFFIIFFHANIFTSNVSASDQLHLSSIGEFKKSERLTEYNIEEINSHYHAFTLDKYICDPYRWDNKNVYIKDDVISDRPIILSCRNLFIQGSLQAPNLTFDVQKFFSVNSNPQRLFNAVSARGQVDYSCRIQDNDVNEAQLTPVAFKTYVNQIDKELGLLRSTVGDIIIRARDEIVCVGSIIDSKQNISLITQSYIHLETAKRRSSYERIFSKQVAPGLFAEKIARTYIDTLCPRNIIHCYNDLLLEAAAGCKFYSNWTMGGHNILLDENKITNKPVVLGVTQSTEI